MGAWIKRLEIYRHNDELSRVSATVEVRREGASAAIDIPFEFYLRTEPNDKPTGGFAPKSMIEVVAAAEREVTAILETASHPNSLLLPVTRAR
jgi:hypothetical protein